MPLIRIDLVEGRNADEIRALMDTIHRAVVDCFDVPERDRYQIVTEHKPGHMILQDTGLGFERSDAMVMVQVFTSPRETDAKLAFYKQVADGLHADCGIAPEDVMISIMTNSQQDWSFGFGEAQYVTGAL